MIRNLTENDFDEYCRVRLKSLEQFPLAYSSMPKYFKEASREMHMDLLEDSASDSSFFVKGYFKNEKLLGVIGLKPETRECIAHKASIWGFYVDPEHQGEKIGRALLAALLDDANSDEKLNYIRLVVCVSCVNAIALFHKAGFAEYGCERDSISDGENYYDQLYMQKDCH